MKTGLEQIKQKAAQDKRLQFNNLLHHISVEQVRAKIKDICRKSASGVDGVTRQMAMELPDEAIQEILSSVHRKAYKAPPVRRVYIPKPGKSEKRPLGIPTIMDRAIQGAVADVLSSIYEADFSTSSFGGRPKLSAHHALSKLHNSIVQKPVNFVLEADLKNFFGSLNHEWMLKFLAHRVTDLRVLDIVRRWLRAGILEDGQTTHSDLGVPQGGPISVILSNIFLHYSLDLWIEKIVRPRMSGEIHYVRYLDDFVICFSKIEDAEKVQRVLPLRLRKFELDLEPNKTRLIRFGRFSRDRIAKFGEGKQQKLNFLGFDLIPVSHKGKFALKMQTNGSRLSRFLQGVKFSIRKAQHLPVMTQVAQLNLKLRGHINYFGITSNSERIQKVRYEALRYWHKVLCHRSQNGKVTWVKMNYILKVAPLAAAKVRLNYLQFVNLVPV